MAAFGAMLQGIFSWHTSGPLVLIEHGLNNTAYLSIVADNEHHFLNTVYPSSNSHYLQDKRQRYKAQISSIWFLENYAEISVLRLLPHSPDLNLIEHFWNWVEQEFCITDVQPTNPQQLCDVIMDQTKGFNVVQARCT